MPTLRFIFKHRLISRYVVASPANASNRSYTLDIVTKLSGEPARHDSLILTLPENAPPTLTVHTLCHAEFIEPLAALYTGL